MCSCWPCTYDMDKMQAKIIKTKLVLSRLWNTYTYLCVQLQATVHVLWHEQVRTQLYYVYLLVQYHGKPVLCMACECELREFSSVQFESVLFIVGCCRWCWCSSSSWRETTTSSIGSTWSCVYPWSQTASWGAGWGTRPLVGGGFLSMGEGGS